MNSTIEQTRPRRGASDPWAEWSDEDLLLEYRSVGDRGAFEELVHRYERELYNYLRHYLGDAEMAEDAFQAAFLQVHLKCQQFEPGRKVRPWLYTVATNQGIDAKRRSRRHHMVSLNQRLQGGHQEEGSGSLMELLDGHDPSPADELEWDEQRRFVREAVDRLPDSLRQVLLLVYYQGLKYREAAEVLAIPVGTVKSRLHAAIRRLENFLIHTQLPPHG
ncbi:MAG: RNA polymerase sigma factor [Planctomycetota bacterium]|jgi:RNA polymerase sigma-70 factor (ECF subfamily)